MHPFDRWPSLQLPRLPLGRWPTPVRPLDPGVGQPVWVKDEGGCAAAYGGNKVRKLELLLADALESGRSEVLTVGAVGSHHVAATAIHGEAAGLATHAVLFPQRETAHARAVAEVIAERCASIDTVDALLALPAGFARAWLRLQRETGERPYRIAPGGSSVLGTVGWVAAGLELADDVIEGRLPRPDRVYAPVGSAGTVAGLWAGLRLAGLRCEVVGVRVATREVGNRANIRRLAKGAVHVLRRHGAPIDRPTLDGLRLEHGFIGDGYGEPDPRGAEAIARAADAGLILEPTYTGKALAACLAEAARLGGVAVFVQTASTTPLPPVTGALPAPMRRLLWPA